MARHTIDLQALKQFYTTVLGFSVLGEFTNHHGYNGVFLGKEKADWHLEFTTSATAPKHKADEDDLLVFYTNTRQEYDEIVSNIKKQKQVILQTQNPYWNNRATCIKDPDGYLVVILPKLKHEV